MKKITSIDEESALAGFEWDSLENNPDVDIWAVRIPAGVCFTIPHFYTLSF